MIVLDLLHHFVKSPDYKPPHVRPHPLLGHTHYQDTHTHVTACSLTTGGREYSFNTSPLGPGNHVFVLVAEDGFGDSIMKVFPFFIETGQAVDTHTHTHTLTHSHTLTYYVYSSKEVLSRDCF